MVVKSIVVTALQSLSWPRRGHFIFFDGGPFFCRSRLQTCSCRRLMSKIVTSGIDFGVSIP